MLCSVIIPLYNKAAFIEYAIQSVLDQRHQRFEIIVVDDGSQDDGAARVRRLRDPRIRLIGQANAGVSRARNRGIAHAQGDLICFLDADDWYLPSYLGTIVAMAKRHADIAYFATGFRRVTTPDGSGMHWDAGDTSRLEVIEDCFDHRRRFGGVFCTVSVAVRRATLAALQPCFPPGESMGEDLDLWFRLAERSRLAYCPAALIGYRMGVGESLTATHTVRELLPAWSRLEERALDGSMPRQLCASALRLVAHERVMLARTALAEGRRGDAFRQLLLARRGATLRNWWTTVALGVGCTPGIMRRWERWRHDRAGNA
ncbi:MAG TPA: glycosyltransferase family A protein [Noviherbaspirillum sp.]|nr:glycosyltransferase family A protein [Noviherbaspirillum sp.]